MVYRPVGNQIGCLLFRPVLWLSLMVAPCFFAMDLVLRTLQWQSPAEPSLLLSRIFSGRYVWRIWAWRRHWVSFKVNIQVSTRSQRVLVSGSRPSSWSWSWLKMAICGSWILWGRTTTWKLPAETKSTDNLLQAEFHSLPQRYDLLGRFSTICCQSLARGQPVGIIFLICMCGVDTDSRLSELCCYFRHALDHSLSYVLELHLHISFTSCVGKSNTSATATNYIYMESPELQAVMVIDRHRCNASHSDPHHL
jgi:hypothetical protein